MKRRIIKDETDLMDLDAGTWKSFTLTPAPEVDTPTYEIVDPVERYDERDHVFARIALKEGSPPFEDYYNRHPEKKEIDADNRKRNQIVGRKKLDKDPVNELLAVSGYLRAWNMSRPEYIKHKSRVRVLAAHSVPQQKIYPDAKQMTRKIKALALHLGAGKVRIAKMNQRWLYSHRAVPPYGEPYELDYPYVICMAFPQNPYMTANQTGLSIDYDVGWHYSYGSFISYAISDFIRSLGWEARQSPTISTPYLIPPLFVDCGIGEDARCGYTMTKEFGINWRPGSLATDLPLVADKPVDFGAQDFCDKCGICAEACPSGAISKEGRQIIRGYRKWHIDADKCYTYWAAIGGTCGICQYVCPWNHVNNWFHNSIRETGQRIPWLRKFLIKGEELFYKNKPKPDPKWIAERVNFTVK